MNRRRALSGFAAGGALLALGGVATRGEAQESASRSRERIVALVRTQSGADPKARPTQKIEPVVMKAETPEAALAAPIFDHFVGDLHLRYVFDDPKFMIALRGHDLKRLGVTREELPTLAVSNFRRLYPKLTVIQPTPGLGVVTEGGELEPTVMLDGLFWEQQTAALGGQLIAAVPSRNEVVFTRREPKQNVELLKHLVVQQYDNAQARALSRTVFAWRYFRWEVIA
jgi:hypothetical protein